MTVSFFLIVTPGLEKAAAGELREKWALLQSMGPEFFPHEPSFETVKGGLLLKCPEGAGWILNHYLKIPTRILQRLDHFRARDFPSLFKRVSKLKWNSFLRQGSFEVKVAATGSRLKIKDRIRQTVTDAIHQSSEKQPLRKAHLPVPQTIYVRAIDDDVDISVDTTGDALYLRGYKTQTIEAPLRETLAAALYWGCRQHLEEDPALILDPMCGAGTLVFEALGFWSVNRLRRFSYENFPHAANITGFNLKKSLGVLGAERGLGFDIDGNAIEAARVNGRNFSKLANGVFEFSVADMNELERPPGEGAVILINPPYNERLKADKDALEEHLEKFLKNARPRLVGIIWPGELPKKWSPRILSALPTTNGGIPITMGILNF